MMDKGWNAHLAIVEHHGCHVYCKLHCNYRAKVCLGTPFPDQVVATFDSVLRLECTYLKVLYLSTPQKLA